MAKRRFEFVDGKSFKYWEIKKNSDGSFTAEWGRIGCANPQSMAYSAYDIEKKIAEKLKKGYTETEE